MIADLNADTWQDSLTLGIEEEFHLIDLRTRRLTPRATELLQALEFSTGSFVGELQQTVIEVNSEVTHSLSELGQNLLGLRAELIRVAHSLGIGIAAAGTVPLSVPLAITNTPRFRRMLADYQLLVREQLICGMQVHVGIPVRDIAARLIERISPWLPPLLALSCSSPYSHAGDDSGYASSRSLIWSRWPTSGYPGSFNSAAEYDNLVQDLVGSGTISDPGMIYFDVRLSAHVPTLELRICDACHSVNTVVLIAGLFRAIVARELKNLDKPKMKLKPALYRTAMWRAARSGLEGELVDLSALRLVPATVLVRRIVQELKPELEATRDWEHINQLAEEVLMHGSDAARQREAFRRNKEIRDVVDLILAETANGIEPLKDSQNPSLLQNYTPLGFDDAIKSDGRTRAGHASVIELLCKLPKSELDTKFGTLIQAKKEIGLDFLSNNNDQKNDFEVDFVPRILSGEEWSRLQGGTLQRARAIEAFLQDIYGNAAIIHEGILPHSVVARSPGYIKSASVWPLGARRAPILGFDVVRDFEGRWLILEDNVRVPSGVAFAIQSRRLLNQAFSEMLRPYSLEDPEEASALLYKTLQEIAPAKASDSPSILLLTSGSTDAAYFEHKMLAEEMGIFLGVPSQLRFEEGRLLFTANRFKPPCQIDVLYLRIENILSQVGQNGCVLGPDLLEAVAAGRLSIANAIGNGLGDDKAIYSYIPQFIEYYLGERPLLEQVPTYHCADPEQCKMVLSRLNELVIKPVDGYGGLDVVVGSEVSREELATTALLITAQPWRWIAQEIIQLSTHPSFDKGCLKPRHMDLRIFVNYGKEAVVSPAALTRMAPLGSLIVNSSRGGGAKDTWILN